MGGPVTFGSCIGYAPDEAAKRRRGEELFLMSRTGNEPSLGETTTPSVPPPAGSVHTSRSRLLVILVGVVMLVLGLLGGWMLAGDGDDSATWGGGIDDAVLAEIDELLADYWAAWDAGDGEALVAVMATDGYFASSGTPADGYSGDALARYVASWGYLGRAQVGPTTVIETPAGYEVLAAERVYGYYPDPFWDIQDFVIIEEDGELAIASVRVLASSSQGSDLLRTLYWPGTG
jgi:hypothetical protein